MWKNAYFGQFLDLTSTYIVRDPVKTKERLNQSNLKTYCKCCINALGEEEGKKTHFLNKTDRIVQHLKKCTHFLAATTPDIRNEIFLLQYQVVMKNNQEVINDH